MFSMFYGWRGVHGYRKKWGYSRLRGGYLDRNVYVTV
jgi:hypothetical protein